MLVINILFSLFEIKANRGFSIGIDDVQPGEILREKKDNLIAEANKACDELIERSKAGLLENQPGCNEEQTLEVFFFCF